MIRMVVPLALVLALAGCSSAPVDPDKEACDVMKSALGVGQVVDAKWADRKFVVDEIRKQKPVDEVLVSNVNDMARALDKRLADDLYMHTADGVTGRCIELAKERKWGDGWDKLG